MKGHIRDRSPGVWALVIDVATDATVKRRRKWFTVRGRKREAQKELTRRLAEVQTGTFADSGRLTLGEWLETWLRDWAKPNIRPSTYEDYERTVRLHVVPVLGKVRLDRLSPTQ